MQLSENSTVLILSHFYKRAIEGGGPPQEIRDYLLGKVKKIVYIEHPFPYADDRRSSITIYEKGKITEQRFTSVRRGPPMFFYIADFWISAYFILASNTQFDVCIALDCLNTVSMLPFRFTGFTKKLIFYTIDYVPKRFTNILLNTTYHIFDRLACRFADTIWVLSPTMPQLRKKNGVAHMSPSITLPMGANLQRIRTLPVSKIHRHQLIFAGHLLEKQGLQLVIQSLPKIIKKMKIVRLVVIGKGEYEQTLKALAKNLDVEKYVHFLGFVDKHTMVEKLLCKSAIGIATYKPTPDNYTYFTDPGKPKLYLGCGLPVVITDVPAIARVIHAQKAGMIVEYNQVSITKAIINLLSNDNLYTTYRNNALRLSKRYDTGSLIQKALYKTA